MLRVRRIDRGWIIPAYAGSTRSGLGACRTPSDHPRIRGEHLSGLYTGDGQFGSSPHTRGARNRPAGSTRPARIIPAYAGSTRFWCRRRPRDWDHPRIRGEHHRRPTPSCRTRGSSPHTRGALALFACANDCNGIIPAYAGSTTSAPRYARPRADHPRIRGEHAARRSILRISPGSSPHTRGAQIISCSRFVPARIIPAYAGSTRGPAERGRCY